MSALENENDQVAPGRLSGASIGDAYRVFSDLEINSNPSLPNTVIVSQALEEGVSWVDLPSHTGLKRRKITEAIGYLRRSGRLEKLSTEEVRNLRREAAFINKNSSWPAIEGYALMHFTPREIKVAVRIEKEKDFSISKIDGAVWGQRRRVKDERLKRTPEDEKDAARVTYDSDAVVEERIRDLLVVKTLLEKHGIAFPQKRVDWQVLIKVLRIKKRKLLNPTEDTSDLESQVGEIPEEQLIQLQPRIDILQDFSNSMLYHRVTAKWDDSLYRLWREEEENERTNLFVRELVNNGFLTKNLSYWERLQRLYEHYDRKLPDSFTERMKLEAFLAASLHLGINNLKVYVAYMKTAEDAGYRFAKGEEELFIEDIIRRAVVTKRSSQ